MLVASFGKRWSKAARFSGGVDSTHVHKNDHNLVLVSSNLDLYCIETLRCWRFCTLLQRETVIESIGGQ